MSLIRLFQTENNSRKILIAYRYRLFHQIETGINIKAQYVIKYIINRLVSCEIERRFSSGVVARKFSSGMRVG
jgi:hypothetical protein